tara:strand:- start:2010 stop:2249 length:240 start_codon:yes stop_codon:yes gene_type:complete
MIDDPFNFMKVKRGSELPQSKLTEETVKEARKLYKEARQAIRDLQDLYSAKGLAERYGVHVRTMEKALAGITWSRVDED